MFHGRTLLLFLPLLAQAYCIPFAKSSRAADATRKLLWPVVLWLARRFSYNSFDPPELYFPWNIALFGVVPCYAVARSLFFALCDPENNYTWTGKTPPSTSLGRAVEVLLSMRGLSWSYGAKAPTPPPLAKDTPTFVKRIMIRLLLSHLGMVIFAFPIVHLCKTQVRLDHVLLSPLGIPTNAVSATSVNMLYAMLFGLVAYVMSAPLLAYGVLTPLNTAFRPLQTMHHGISLLLDGPRLLPVPLLFLRPQSSAQV